jgi:copper homeostasis protein
MQLELVAESFEEAELAANYAFQRVELCSALTVGGLTPSAGMIKQCAKYAQVEIHVLIRPRPGHFVYTETEVAVMLRDIREAAKLGARGVVIGALTTGGIIDREACERMHRQATNLGLETTFHRAFDFVNEAESSLEQLITMGFDRLLTSGQKPTAIEGIDTIRQLVKHAKGRIQIMAGSGVNEHNCKALSQTGVSALHFSARKTGAASALNMGEVFEPDKEKIERILRNLKN